MKQLIVNADDFGLHEQINRGIIRGFRQGFITSASLMCSAPACDDALSWARQYPALGVGIHLTLVGSVPPVLPCARVASLVDAQGLLLPDYVAFARGFYSGRIKKAEIEAELRAQIEKALASGIRITHLDSHQHIHVLPILAELVVQLCCEYKIPALRIPREKYLFFGGFGSGPGRFLGRLGLSACASWAARKADSRGLAYPQHFFGMLVGGHLNRKLLQNILLALPDGVTELMTHPGLGQRELEKNFLWDYHWEEELEAFLAEENVTLLQRQGVVLMNFGGLIR